MFPLRSKCRRAPPPPSWRSFCPTPATASPWCPSTPRGTDPSCPTSARQVSERVLKTPRTSEDHTRPLSERDAHHGALEWRWKWELKRFNLQMLLVLMFCSKTGKLSTINSSFSRLVLESTAPCQKSLLPLYLVSSSSCFDLFTANRSRVRCSFDFWSLDEHSWFESALAVCCW